MHEELIETQPQEIWAVVELMGHGQTAGRISRPANWGGLMQVDIPTPEGYRTEFYGMSAIYAVRIVSEEIARAYAQPVRGIVAYDTPIVTREQHNQVISELNKENYQLQQKIEALVRRLTLVLPADTTSNEED